MNLNCKKKACITSQSSGNMYASCGDETSNNVNNVYEAVGIGGVGVGGGVGDGGGVGGGVGSFGGGGSVVMVNGVAVDTQQNEENIYDTCDSAAGNPYASGGPMAADRGAYYEDISGGPMVDRGAYEDIPC